MSRSLVAPPPKPERMTFLKCVSIGLFSLAAVATSVLTIADAARNSGLFSIVCALLWFIPLAVIFVCLGISSVCEYVESIRYPEKYNAKFEEKLKAYEYRLKVEEESEGHVKW